MKSLTQNEMILNLLENGNKLTALDAYHLTGSMNLRSRISDLKKQGIDINVEFETGRNRFNQSVTYAVYSLAGVEDE